jgi:molybdopterin molybdotransferase
MMSDFPEDVTLDSARALIAPLMQDIGKKTKSAETVPLDEATSRILSSDIISPIDVPQKDVAAVDGYAFYYKDLAKPLPVTGSIKAGHPYDGEASRGQAYRIFTGAPMPYGPDTIAMQEHCSFDVNGCVLLPQKLNSGANCRQRGENVTKGEVVLNKGTVLGPAEIGLAAAIGLTEVSVTKMLKVGLVSMGDEITEAGSKAGLDQIMIFDSNRPMLKAMISGLGHQVVDYGILGDDCALLEQTFQVATQEADVILSSGGSSEGDEDHTKSALMNCGGIIDFWRLALKPGRPLVSGRIGDVPVFGLPGSPVAAFVCTRLFIGPMLDILQGGRGRLPLAVLVESGFTRHHRKGRAEYLRARLENSDNGLHVVLNGKPGAGVLSSLTGADGLVEIPATHDDVAMGDALPFFMFREAGL